MNEQHGARFQAIDLRWGVRDEAAVDQRTMEICLTEIERCQKTGIKPNFIVLLGDRYGWQPLPSRIPASELDPRPVVGDWNPGHHLTKLTGYKLDENAVPAEYVLQPRTGIFTNPDIWIVMEELLHARLESAARAAGLFNRGPLRPDRDRLYVQLRERLPDRHDDADLVAPGVHDGVLLRGRTRDPARPFLRVPGGVQGLRANPEGRGAVFAVHPERAGPHHRRLP